MARKTNQSEQPNLRSKLSEAFVQAVEADFRAHGAGVIEQLRQKYPQHYAETVARLIVSTQEPSGPSDFSDCKTRHDIGIKLLRQVGLPEDAITTDMAERAATANDVLVDCLEEIAQGN
jgi:hypothetical protein